MTPEMVVREWFEQVWTQQREEAVDRLMAPDALVHDLPTADGAPMRGPAAFKPFHRRFVAAFPDISIDVTRTLVDGNMVAAH
jgi:predicted SnoaL-like aldol condensation-catalyzing enzyme